MLPTPYSASLVSPLHQISLADRATSALAQQHRPDLHADILALGVVTLVGCREVLPAKVVDQSARRQHVERAQRAVRSGALRVVVIAVDREDGQADVEVRVLVVDRRELERAPEAEAGVTHDLELDRPRAHAELAQYGRRLVHARPRRLVLVEEIAAEQDHVDLTV